MLDELDAVVVVVAAPKVDCPFEDTNEEIEEVDEVEDVVVEVFGSSWYTLTEFIAQ